MQNLKVRAIGLCLASALSIAAGEKAHAGIRAFGSAGYASVTNEEGSSESKEVTGYDLNLTGQFDVFSLPAISIYAGPSFKSANTSSEYSMGGIAVTQELTQTHAGVEAGVNFGLIPLITLQGGLNYNVGLSGKLSLKRIGSTTADFDAESGSEMGATVRALLTPFPLLRAGAELGVGSGKVQFGDEAPETKYSYWSARAVVGLSL